MRYNGNTKVLVPYMNTEGTREWMLMNLNGDVDKRRIYRMVRKIVKETFGRSVTKTWLRTSVLIAAPGTVHVPTPEQTNAMVEAFIQRMQQDETEGQSDTTGQEGIAKEAGGSLCSL